VSPKKIAAPLDIYVRVSDTRGRGGESFISPRDQEERCSALAKARGHEVGRVFTDLDVSGGKMKRPALDSAIARIEEGVSAGIIVAKLDRFARTLVGGLQTLEEINSLGGVVIVADGEFDTSTATGELVLNMMLSLAQFELRRIKETWASSKSHAVERGIHITRHVPPGYARGDDKHLVPHPEFADAVRTAFGMAAQGESYSRVAAHLTEAKVPSGDTAAPIWQANRIKRLLANPAYLGQARSGNGHTNADAHPPLVDEATWLLAQRKPSGPVLSLGAETLLAGICRCASCSFSMRSQSARGSAVAAYRCSTNSVHGRCPSPSTISLLRLEYYVLDQFLARASDVSLRQVDEEQGDEDAAALVVEAERRYQAALTNVELRAKIGDADHDRMVAALYDAKQEALAAVPMHKPAAQVPAGLDLAELVSELQRREDTASLRELLASTIQAVFVRPAASRARNLPIEDRVRIVWADEESLTLPKRGERFEPRVFAW
jgi:DNA invertase Pin-like site-specific DNA recombinase